MSTKIKTTRALGLLLMAGLAVLSCKDDDKNVIDYHAYAVFPRYVNPAANGGGEIKLSILSNKHDTKSIETEAVYTDTKTSELVAPGGQVIKPGETFRISGINKTHTYKFNSSDTSLHAVEFQFKNADGLDNFVQKADIWVKGYYEFSVVLADNTAEVNKPIKIAFAYKAFDPTPQTCDITFETATDADATINGKKQSELTPAQPLRIVNTGGSPALPLTGTLDYVPTVAGTHTVTVTVRNEFGFEKTAAFTVVVH